METGNAIDDMDAENEMNDDSGLPANAQHHAQHPSADELMEDDESIKQSIQKYLHDLGMNINRGDIPRKTDGPQYYTCHKDLSDFWGIRLEYKPQKADINRRYRLASVKIHPDKALSLSTDVRRWCTELHTISTLAREEMVQQIQWIEDRKIPPPVQQKGILNQELTEEFQLALLQILNPTMQIINTSDVSFNTMGLDIQPRRSIDADSARIFFEKLLLSGDDGPKDSLDTILSTVMPPTTFLQGSSWVLAVTRLPSGFLDWLRLRDTRIVIHLILLADAFPAQWPNTLKYWDSQARGSKTETCRIKQTFLDPCVMAVVGAGLGPVKILKKAMVVSLAAHLEPAPGLQEFLRWRQDLIPSFLSSARLYIDFPRNDAVQVQAVAEELAHRYDARYSGYTFRSFGDSPSLKRRALFLGFPSMSAMDDATLINNVNAFFNHRGLHGFVGWEQLFEAPTESYIISFDGSSFSADLKIMGILSEVVLVAKNRAIVKLASGAAYAELEAKVKHYNSMNVENKFRRIHNSDRKQLWCETREPASAPEIRRAKGIPHPSPSDTILRMDVDIAVLKEAATAFVAGAQAHLAGKGYQFARSIQVHPQFASGMFINRTILIFPSTETARVFVFLYLSRLRLDERQRYPANHSAVVQPPLPDRTSGTPAEDHGRPRITPDRGNPDLTERWCCSVGAAVIHIISSISWQRFPQALAMPLGPVWVLPHLARCLSAPVCRRGAPAHLA